MQVLGKREHQAARERGIGEEMSGTRRWLLLVLECKAGLEPDAQSDCLESIYSKGVVMEG